MGQIDIRNLVHIEDSAKKRAERQGRMREKRRGVSDFFSPVRPFSGSMWVTYVPAPGEPGGAALGYQHRDCPRCGQAGHNLPAFETETEAIFSAADVELVVPHACVPAGVVRPVSFPEGKGGDYRTVMLSQSGLPPPSNAKQWIAAVPTGTANNTHIFDCTCLSAHSEAGKGMDFGAGENGDWENVVVESPTGDRSSFR